MVNVKFEEEKVHDENVVSCARKEGLKEWWGGGHVKKIRSQLNKGSQNLRQFEPQNW